MVTAVANPPRSALTSATRRPARLPGHLLRATSSPERLRLLLIGLVALCLAWGVLAAWAVSQRASGASLVVSVSEPVSLDGQQIYRALSDADATEAAAFLSGGLEPIAARHRYQADIATAASRLEAATASAGDSAVAKDLATLSASLPVYAGEVETARADNRLGLPLGAAYLREASGLMRSTLLPAARHLSDQADSQLTRASAQTTGLPLALILLGATVIVGFVLYRSQRWLYRLTHRRLNLGLAAASAAIIVSVLWLAVALTAARGDLLQAGSHGSAPVEALASAEVAALQARADESLTLIDAGGDDSFQADFLTVQHNLGPGQGTLLTDAVLASRSSPASGQAARAATAATAWYAGHRALRALDDNGGHTKAVQLVTTPGTGHASTLFAHLDSALTAGIAADDAVFQSNATAARNSFTGLEIGIIVLALIMAIGCGRGLAVRLGEYR